MQYAFGLELSLLLLSLCLAVTGMYLKNVNEDCKKNENVDTFANVMLITGAVAALSTSAALTLRFKRNKANRMMMGGEEDAQMEEMMM